MTKHSTNLARAFLTLVLATISAATVTAQVPAQSPNSNQAAAKTDAGKPRSIRVRSGLVLVPAIVTNSSGERATGLTLGNFTILKNGRPQRVTFFQHIEASAQVTKRPVTPPNVFTNAGEPRSQRLTIFVLDQLNSSLTEQDTARQQLVKFLSAPSSSSTANQDPLCLLSLDATGLNPLHDFTTDPALLAQALEQFSKHGTAKDSARAQDNPLATTFRMVQGWHSPSAVRNAASAEGRMAVLQATIESRQMVDSLRIRLTLEALRNIAEYLSIIPGRKSLIWSTSGFPFELDDHAIFGTRELDLLAVYDDTWRALNRANIAIYPLDVESLQNPAYAGPADGTPLPEHVESLPSAVANLEKFAAATGGRLCDRTMDAQSCFSEADKDSSDYYLLGFYEDSAAKPGWQKLAVKVNLPKLQVRARSGYYITTTHEDDHAKQKELQLALTSPLNFTGVPLTVTWNATITHNDEEKRQIRFILAIAPDGISLDESAAGQPGINLEFSAQAVTAAGVIADSVSQSFVANPKPELAARIKVHGMTALGQFQLAPGEYSVTFAVRDNFTEQIGTVTAPLSVH